LLAAAGVGYNPAMALIILVQDDQGANHARNPGTAGQDGDDENGTTALVNDSQGRENNR